MLQGTSTILHRLVSEIAMTTVAMIMLSATAVTPAAAQSQGYSLEITNASRYDIYAVYMSRTRYQVWGPDQLGRSVLTSGSGFTITDIPAGVYDLKVVDQDGDACVVEGVPVFTDKTWVLTTDRLLACEIFH